MTYVKIIAVSLVLLIFSYSCQRKEKIYRIGYISTNSEEEEIAQGFLSNMPRFGFIEGKNLKCIKCGNEKNIEAALREMVAKNVNLILTITTPDTKMARKITEGTDIPVVFAVYDPVESGLVNSLTKPGGNLTGVQLRGSVPKTLEWLLKVKPDAKHIFVPVKFDTGAARMSMEDLKKSVVKAGLKMTVSEVATVKDLRASLSSMPKDIDAIFIVHSIFIGSNMETIINAAIKRKIPVVSSGHEHYKQGAVISYSDAADHTGWQIAHLAGSILRGSSPAELPVEIANFSLGVNLKTARSIGLEISEDVLQQAENIIR